MIKLSLLFLLLVFSMAQIRAQSAEEIITRYLDTVSSGDITNLYKVKTIYIESEGIYSQENYDGFTPSLTPRRGDSLRQYKVWPNKEKIEIYDDSSRTELKSSFFRLNGAMKIVIGNMPPVEGSPNVYFELPPVKIHKLLKDNTKVISHGLHEINLLPYYHIEIHAKEHGEPIIYHLYFDPATSLLVYQDGSADGKSLSRIDDYKWFGKILLPTSTVSIRNGNIFFSNRITKMIIDGDIDEDVFNLPKK